MANVLRVSAFHLGNPISDFVLVKGDNFPLH